MNGGGRLALQVSALLIMGIGWGGNIMLAKLATTLGAPPAGLAFLEAAGSGLLLLPIACAPAAVTVA